MLKRPVPVLDSVCAFTHLVWLFHPGERAVSPVSFMQLSLLWHSHARHVATLPWLSEQGRGCRTAVTLCTCPPSPSGKWCRNPGMRTSVRSAEAVLFHLALCTKRARADTRRTAAHSLSKGDLVSEPLFSLKQARFVDLKGTLKTTLFLIGICRGYEPREHVVKRELGYVFTWFHFILFLSRCSTLFYLLWKCLQQLDRHFSACKKSKEI